MIIQKVSVSSIAKVHRYYHFYNHLSSPKNLRFNCHVKSVSILIQNKFIVFLSDMRTQTKHTTVPKLYPPKKNFILLLSTQSMLLYCILIMKSNILFLLFNKVII